MRPTDLFELKCKILLISHWLYCYKGHFVEPINFFVNKMRLFESTEFFSQCRNYHASTVKIIVLAKWKLSCQHDKNQNVKVLSPTIFCVCLSSVLKSVKRKKIKKIECKWASCRNRSLGPRKIWRKFWGEVSILDLLSRLCQTFSFPPDLRPIDIKNLK